ncbi:hypothetical protein D3C78_1843140 [compost metagenome]
MRMALSQSARCWASSKVNCALSLITVTRLRLKLKSVAVPETSLTAAPLCWSLPLCWPMTRYSENTWL